MQKVMHVLICTNQVYKASLRAPRNQGHDRTHGIPQQEAKDTHGACAQPPPCRQLHLPLHPTRGRNKRNRKIRPTCPPERRGGTRALEEPTRRRLHAVSHKKYNFPEQIQEPWPQSVSHQEQVKNTSRSQKP